MRGEQRGPREKLDKSGLKDPRGTRETRGTKGTRETKDPRVTRGKRGTKERLVWMLQLHHLLGWLNKVIKKFI